MGRNQTTLNLNGLNQIESVHELIQSLVDLMMIDIELDRKDYGSILCNCNPEGAETTRTGLILECSYISSI
jgi:hypothetical protein